VPACSRKHKTTRMMHSEGMTLPLSTLLSQTLVAFTIEVDYEFEQLMPHFTTEGLKAGNPVQGPWLISLPFWSMCLKHVPEEGTTVAEVLERGFLGDKFLLGTNPGMVRWGYLRLDRGDSTSKRPNTSWTVRLTPSGRQAQQTFAPLPDLIESRWIKRWKSVSELRRVLEDLVGAFDHALPDHVPINGSDQSRVSTSSRPGDDQKAEVERLLSLGARLVDIGQGEVPWVVMADPEDNEFCVLTPR